MKVAVERTTGQAMLSTASDSFGAFFIAYDPTVESEYTLEWTDGLLDGELFTEPDADGIVLGEVLAENLDAELGDKVVYTLTDRSGEIVSGMERLSGIITTGSRGHRRGHRAVAHRHRARRGRLRPEPRAPRSRSS